MPIKQNSNGLFTLALRSSTVLDLIHLLDVAVPLVFIPSFRPTAGSKWWRAQVPFSMSGKLTEARVRHIEYDLEMPTKEFIEKAAEFSHNGMRLFSLQNTISQNLSSEMLRCVPDQQLTDTLIKGGMVAFFDLPHPGEVSVFASTSRQRLELAVQLPELRDRCL